MQAILDRPEKGETIPKYTLSQNILYKNGKIVVGKDQDLYSKIIKLFHDSSLGGHSGVVVTAKRVMSLFLVEGPS